MLSLHYGFASNVRRSGHAACWCPPLQGVVQFGGWPPSEELSRTIHQDGSCCPLYVLTAREMCRGAARAASEERKQDAHGFTSMASGVPRHAHEDDITPRTGTAASPPSGSQAGMGTETARSPSLASAPGHSRRVWLRAARRGDRHAAGAEHPRGSVQHVPSAHPSAASRSPQRNCLPGVGAVEGEGSSASTDDASSEASAPPSEHYGDGYVSEPSTPNDGSEHEATGSGTTRSPNSSAEDDTARVDPSALPAASQPASSGPAVAPIVTAELLRGLGSSLLEYGGPMRAADATTASTSDRATATETASSVFVPTLPSAFGGTGSWTTARGELFREAPPLTRASEEVPGKHNTRPLRWRAIREIVAPRTRHGHHLVYHDYSLYVIGGSYWAHGNALASSDMRYDLRHRCWHQLGALFPTRFCAALAESNATPTRAAAEDASRAADKVLYYFGGSDFTQQLTSTLYRLWLPSGAVQELPQYGASPRAQFKGVLVCDAQEELSADEARSRAGAKGDTAGARAVSGCHTEAGSRAEERAALQSRRARGRLYYLDGFQAGRPMAPALRYYGLETGVWVRVGACPDLVRSQVAMVSRAWAPPAESTGAPSLSASAPSSTMPGRATQRADRGETLVAAGPVLGRGEGTSPATASLLTRFEVFGGMPSRRGRQRRSRVCYAYDARAQCFDYTNALPVPGLTAHAVVLLPSPAAVGPVADGDEASHRLQPPAGAVTTSALPTVPGAAVQQLLAAAAADAEGRWARRLCDVYGICAVSIGGNEDFGNDEQNSLGEPVSWAYLLGPRAVPLAERARVFIEVNRIPYKVLLAPRRDELLDELF